MFCTNCGAQVANDGQFCPSCGRKLNQTGALPISAPLIASTSTSAQGRYQHIGNTGVMVGRVIGGDMQTVILGLADGRSNTVARSDIGFPVANGDMLDIYISPDGTKRYAPHEDMPRASKNRVNKIVYILLAVILGDIGAHKFYCGKIGIGLLYLAFCWTTIPAVVGLIEGILAIGKPTDAYGNIEIS